MLAFVARDPDPRPVRRRRRSSATRTCRRAGSPGCCTGSTAPAGPPTGRSRVFVVPADGSAPPRAVTPGPFEASGLAWSPDSAVDRIRVGPARGVGPGPGHRPVRRPRRRQPGARGGHRRRAELVPAVVVTRRHGAGRLPQPDPAGVAAAPPGRGDRPGQRQGPGPDARPWTGTARRSAPPSRRPGPAAGCCSASTTAATCTCTWSAPTGRVPRSWSPAATGGCRVGLGRRDAGVRGRHAGQRRRGRRPRPRPGPAGAAGPGRRRLARTRPARRRPARTRPARRRPARSRPAGGGQPERTLTRLSAALTARVALGAPQRFTATSEGGAQVECWAIPPAGAVPGTRYPTLLNVHGGPFTQYGNRLVDDFQLQAAAGFGVLYCNPRGSSGYTEQWGRAIRGPQAESDPGTGWGAVDFADVHGLRRHRLRAVRLDRPRQARHPGRVLRRVHDLVGHRPHRPVQGRLLRAGLQQPAHHGALRRHRRVRPQLRRHRPRHRPGRLPGASPPSPTSPT